MVAAQRGSSTPNLVIEVSDKHTREHVNPQEPQLEMQTDAWAGWGGSLENTTAYTLADLRHRHSHDPFVGLQGRFQRDSARKLAELQFLKASV